MRVLGEGEETLWIGTGDTVWIGIEVQGPLGCRNGTTVHPPAFVTVQLRGELLWKV